MEPNQVIVTRIEWFMGELMLEHFLCTVNASEMDLLKKFNGDCPDENLDLFFLLESVRDEQTTSDKCKMIDTKDVYRYELPHFFLNFGQVE